ncbi:Vacuolar protein sorting-associated protein 16 -like protein [Sarcoptes scabiei]|uniref:Vacuolar protein sorting-associated protein 16 homolog n=1 Tax=Sarcoptes scabiei TaxID=52283 RepID=A0A834RDK5_SARSC|nr:Vacuolar protein sorting-associated protein 16 -like protein [Sarcoptes scabiei]
MSLFTSNWNYLGETIFKKFEICSMLWGGEIDLNEFHISSANYGGPIALVKKIHSQVKSHQQNVRIYSAFGELLSEFSISEDIIQIGWSHREEFICVLSNGFISLYDMFGQHNSTLTLDQEIRDSKLIECKIYKNDDRTEIPLMKEPPTCWEILTYDIDTRLIVSHDKELTILRSQDLGLININPFGESFDEFITAMAVSFDYSRIAFFTETGKLFIANCDSNLPNCMSVFSTESKIKPKQLTWCGKDAVACHWTNLIFFVDNEKNWLKYPTYGNVHMIQEIDCIRVIDSDFQELITKVDESAVEIFKIGSWSSGANLLEASRLFEQENHKVDDYIRLIEEKNEMEYAVNACLKAACHEFDISTQKLLLRASTFGKCFAKNCDSDSFYRVCQRLRILNALRNPDVGIPLTYNQLERININVIIDRLIERRHFLLALRIAQFLQIVPEDGMIKILTKWAFFKIRQPNIDEEEVAARISRKIQPKSGVSFAEIANKAIEYGRKNLAIKLLDLELKATEQVPLLLKLKEYRRALQRAIESGNTNLIHMVVLSFKKIQTNDQFYLGLRDFPIAYNLYQKYCRQDDREQLRNIYIQETDHISEGFSYLEQSIELESEQNDQDQSTKNYRKNKITLITTAMDKFKRSRNNFLSQHIDEYCRLLKYQLRLESKFVGIKFFDLSLQQTLACLLKNHEIKLCEELKKEFKISEKRYYHQRLLTMAEMSEWQEIEQLSKGKKSPIGYEPFVDVCIQFNNRYEAQKYLPRIRDENKIKYFIKVGNLDDAAKFAQDAKDFEALRYIMSKCIQSGNRILQEKIRQMIEN